MRKLPFARIECRLLAALAAATLCASSACAISIAGLYTGTTNYVSKSGNDANNGKSWAFTIFPGVTRLWCIIYMPLKSAKEQA